VNDIAAIQTADVAAALLTGFGHENHLNIDIDDKRRMKALEDKNIGGNRSRNKGTSKVLKKLSQQRIQKRISLAQRRIDDRARERQRKAGEEGVISLTKYYTLDDTKELLSAVMEAHKDENRRRKILLSGASEAARILAEERNSESQDSDTTIDNGSSMADQTSIKPGEVSLVAPFSCLHPSIDGVESILRQGIATAACVIATQQNIILHSVMSCFHLATLYRDGFRYGSFMWPVESTFYSILGKHNEKFSTG
jgi:cation-transporting ATPase 13A1